MITWDSRAFLTEFIRRTNNKFPISSVVGIVCEFKGDTRDFAATNLTLISPFGLIVRR